MCACSESRIVLGVYPRACGVGKNTSGLNNIPQGLSRACGVGAEGRCWTKTLTGLSPRVRGGCDCRARTEPPLGFIPACAGWVASPAAREWPQWVYPRVCGVGTLIFKGSCPYEWGKKLDCSTQSAWRASLPSDSTHALPSRMRTLPVYTVGSLLRVYSMMPEVCPYVVRTSWM